MKLASRLPEASTVSLMAVLLTALATTNLFGQHALGHGSAAATVNADSPPQNVGLLDGRLAWRQPDRGHTDEENWRCFIAWRDRFLRHTTPAVSKPSSLAQVQVPADQPVSRIDQNSLTAHAQLLEKANR